MGQNKANRGNPRKKPVTIVLTADEWQQLAKYSTRYNLAPTAGARRLINEGLAFHQ